MNPGEKAPHPHSNPLRHPVDRSGAVTDEDRDAGKVLAFIYALFEVCHDLNIAVLEDKDDDGLFIIDAPLDIQHAVLFLAMQRLETVDMGLFVQFGHAMNERAAT